MISTLEQRRSNYKTSRTQETKTITIKLNSHEDTRSVPMIKP